VAKPSTDPFVASADRLFEILPDNWREKIPGFLLILDQTKAYRIRDDFFSQRISTSGEQIVFGTGSGSVALASYGSFANQAEIYAGTAWTATASDGALHAVQNLFNGALSSIYVDGSNNSVASPGTLGFGSGSSFVVLGHNSFSGSYLNGYFLEAGVWAWRPVSQQFRDEYQPARLERLEFLMPKVAGFCSEGRSLRLQ
jgi:hypothetical protein